jgi:hypothetical protein
MGFFEGFKRVLQGKPVYTPEDVEQQQGTVPQNDEQPLPGVAAPVQPLPVGPKLIPIVRIGRVEPRVSGQRLDVYADLHNESTEQIFLDKIMLLGVTHQLDRQLSSGESHQFLIYSGPLLVSPPAGYAEIHYRKQADGDYFACYHQIRVRQEADGTYTITEFLLQGPIKDI